MTILDAVNAGVMNRGKQTHWSYEGYANGLIRIWEKLKDIPIAGDFGFFCFQCDREF